MNLSDVSTDASGDEEYVLPSVDALMAGTLALMTGYSQTPETCPNRSLMARKLVSNLFFLANHPHVSPTMRCMLGNLRTRWQLVLEAATVPTPTPTATWVAAHDTLQ